MTEPTNIANAVLVFDWGDTLMKVFPQYSGPMAGWPEVAAVEGVIETLESMQYRNSMVVATNATDSQSDQVRKALQRAGLEKYFKAVFTARELGSQKPDVRFFHQIESVLARQPHELVMVGDDYRGDVLGAKAAGWRTIWYNPRHLAATGTLPLHDLEIHHMRDLPLALKKPSLPDYTTCLAWLMERGAQYNLLAHVQLVSAVAYQLAVWLSAKGEKVDALLVHRGGMLHDMAKMESIRLQKERGQHGDHARMAAEMLLALGQPVLAEIADRHMLYAKANDPRRPTTWEEKLVHFADKLAEGTGLVPVEQRIRALTERYAKMADEIAASQPRLEELQSQICTILEVTPDELVANLREALGLA